MSRATDVWRLRLGLWLPAALFFAVNLALFSVYRLVIASEFAGLEQRLAARSAEHAALEQRRRRVEDLLRRAELNRERIEILYRDRFSTRSRRFTQVVEEVKDLARRAGLAPQTILYPEAEIEDYALLERSFQFGVEGTYPQLRTFINLLELSPSFLTLKQVALSGGQDGGASLRINLTLSTLFVEDDRVAAEGPLS